MTPETGIPPAKGRRRYFAVLLSVISLLVLAALLNVAVDPYFVYRSPRIEGFNQWKVKFFFGQYVAKPLLLESRKPRHLVLGSSTADCFRPDHPVFRGESAFNYALAGSAPYIQSVALSHALERGSVRSVILGVDLAAYNAFADQRAFRDYVDLVEPGGGARVGWRRMRRRFEVLLGSALDPDTFADALSTVEGQRVPGVGGEFRNIRDDGFWTNPRPVDIPQLRMFTTIEHNYLGRGWFPLPERRFAFDDGRGRSTLAELDELVGRAVAANVELRIVIMPVHARLAEAIHEAELWQTFDELKRRVVSVAHGSGGDVQVWDFSGYHAFSMGAVRDAAADTPWFEDSIHPSTATGDLMLWRMFDPAGAPELPAEFGRLLEPSTLESALAAAVTRRGEYRTMHPADVQNVQRIAERLRAQPDGG